MEQSLNLVEQKLKNTYHLIYLVLYHFYFTWNPSENLLVSQLMTNIEQ